MNHTVYRGICFTEAMTVLSKQKYEKEERRSFSNGVAAKAVFGPGIYLISDVELAAQYAFCHAEIADDLATVMIQQLSYVNPFILNQKYGEGRLRQDAINWKYPDGNFPQINSYKDSLKLVQWTGEIIKEYLLHLKFDGIIYYVKDNLTYYVSYFPDKQIKDIQIDFIFDISNFK